MIIKKEINYLRKNFFVRHLFKSPAKLLTGLWKPTKGFDETFIGLFAEQSVTSRQRNCNKRNCVGTHCCLSSLLGWAAKNWKHKTAFLSRFSVRCCRAVGRAVVFTTCGITELKIIHLSVCFSFFKTLIFAAYLSLFTLLLKKAEDSCLLKIFDYYWASFNRDNGISSCSA